MKQYIIDGYNLMHQIPALKSRMNTDLQGSRAAFLDRLSEYAICNHIQIHVVFDGNWVVGNFSQRRAHVKVQFSNPPQKADPVIKKLCDKHERSRQIQIVTSDREIRNYARLCGLRSISSEEFVIMMDDVKSKKVENQTSKEPELSDSEVEEWLRLFGGAQD